MPLKAKVKGYIWHVMFCLLPVEGFSNLESVVYMQSSVQEVTMLSKLIAAAKDSWACFFFVHILIILQTQQNSIMNTYSDVDPLP